MWHGQKLSILLLASVILSGCMRQPTASDRDQFSSRTQTEGESIINLEGSTWKLMALNREPLLVDDFWGQTSITMSFPHAGIVGGRSGCNEYYGRFTLEGSDLQFQNVEVSEIACLPQEIMDQEDYYLEILNGTNRVMMPDPDLMYLYDDQGRMLLYYANEQ